MTRTFSGAHPFSPQHLIDAFLECGDPGTERDEATDAVSELLTAVGDSHCLRCGEGFNGFGGEEIPSGSRVTDCRCVPICHVCSSAEAYQQDALAIIKGPEDGWLLPLLNSVWDWPVDPSETAKAVAEYRDRFLGPVTEVEIGTLRIDPASIDGAMKYGYDATADEQERER